MQISVTHSTIYRYQYPVILQPHTFRLRPRTNSTQRLLEFDMQISPQPAGQTECLDQDGNLALNAWFDTSTTALTVLCRFRVAMLRDNPFDFALSEASLNLPLRYPDPLSTALASYRMQADVSDLVAQYAKVLAAGAQWNSLTFLTTLNQQLFLTCRHVTRPDGAPWNSDQTLSAREGSCRDLAVLFCDLCRVMGFAARFISGYECAAAGGDDSYMHAWAEVYLPSAGWRGYDPSRGLVVSNAHVAVAAGFDHNLAAPIAGLFSGGIASQMEASIQMQVDPESTT
ncbi:transglutaminase family protein [uncultured Paludibaculum sp.]|uniref:transglutaminase family protein n=1 Tax=uncultured Paludibaculum sp. TaxID=1765020 RepID=UPI002AAA7EBA|nr:transglutaminase family protein [uncultured Paludibaculum sp.]